MVHPARGIRSFIHNEDLEQSWYYSRFEVLNEEKSGWFYPDPATATPYIVITAQP